MRVKLFAVCSFLVAFAGCATGTSGTSSAPTTAQQVAALCTTATATINAVTQANVLTAKGQADLAYVQPLVETYCAANADPANALTMLETVIVPQLAVLALEKVSQ